ncbi:hypothetical protein HFN89_03760 [Rhizobium laguerreae]|nr:hypothetical protein [Rhizobium laguerreae]
MKDVATKLWRRVLDVVTGVADVYLLALEWAALVVVGVYLLALEWGSLEYLAVVTKDDTWGKIAATAVMALLATAALFKIQWWVMEKIIFLSRKLIGSRFR